MNQFYTFIYKTQNIWNSNNSFYFFFLNQTARPNSDLKSNQEWCIIHELFCRELSNCNFKDRSINNIANASNILGNQIAVLKVQC